MSTTACPRPSSLCCVFTPAALGCRLQRCEVTLLIVRGVEAMPSAGSQALEPLLFGEGDRIETRVIVVFDAELPADFAAECGSAAECGEGNEVECDRSSCFVCAQGRLQGWLGEHAWKRPGLVGRVGAEGLFIPFGDGCAQQEEAQVEWGWRRWLPWRVEL